MSKLRTSWPRRILGGGFSSPIGLVIRALLLALFYGVCELAGGREHTTFLSGTAVSSDRDVMASVVYGATYLAAYFGFVLVTPILLLAAAILTAAQRWLGEEPATAEHRAQSPR